jgi:hypothetical protein
MPTSPDMQATFETLKQMLSKHAGRLIVTADGPAVYSLDCPKPGPYGKKNLFFGAVQTRKNYVSYYLMPVYVFPDLLKDAPEILTKRMQGKSCFNFKSIDRPALAALARLTRQGFARFKSEGYI